MSQPDAGVLMFLSTLNEASFRGQNPAQQNDELGDAVKDFIELRQFTVASGVDPAALDREVLRIDSRFEHFLEKSRVKIAGEKKDRPPSPYLYAAPVSGAPLAKGEVASRLFSLLEKLRQYCIGDEEKMLEKAARVLDVPCFCEVAEGVVSRLRARIA